MNIENEEKLSENLIKELQFIIDEIIKVNNNLCLDKLKGVKIVKDSLLDSSSSASYRDNFILLPKNKIEKYINENNYNLIKSTIYHELCHVDIEARLPNLHTLHKKYLQEENYIKVYTIMIYIEYLTHLKSYELETDDNIKIFFKSLNNRNWNFSDEIDCIYFIKCSPYVVARLKHNYENLNLINNKEFKEHILEIKDIFERLELHKDIDDYKILTDLEKYVSIYITND